MSIKMLLFVSVYHFLFLSAYKSAEIHRTGIGFLLISTWKFSISFKNRRRSDRIKNIILKAAGMDDSFQGSRGRGKSDADRSISAYFGTAFFQPVYHRSLLSQKIQLFQNVSYSVSVFRCAVWLFLYLCGGAFLSGRRKPQSVRPCFSDPLSISL